MLLNTRFGTQGPVGRYIKIQQQQSQFPVLNNADLYGVFLTLLSGHGNASGRFNPGKRQRCSTAYYYDAGENVRGKGISATGDESHLILTWGITWLGQCMQAIPDQHQCENRHLLGFSWDFRHHCFKKVPQQLLYMKNSTHSFNSSIRPH